MHNETGAQREFVTMALVHNRTGTQWYWYTLKLVHHVIETQWNWYNNNFKKYKAQNFVRARAQHLTPTPPAEALAHTSIRTIQSLIYTA